MEHKVTGCLDCPLNSNDREYGDACQHPSVYDGETRYRVLPTDSDNGYETITPDWCPLDKEPITISKNNSTTV